MFGVVTLGTFRAAVRGAERTERRPGPLAFRLRADWDARKKRVRNLAELEAPIPLGTEADPALSFHLEAHGRPWATIPQFDRAGLDPRCFQVPPSKSPRRVANARGPDRRFASMPTTLPNGAPPEKLTRPCGSCGRKVMAARDDHGRPVRLEWCIAGKGTHTITAGLIPGIEPTATLCAGTWYRIHNCPTEVPKAHSAASFEGKRGSPSISYRSSDRPRYGLLPRKGSK